MTTLHRNLTRKIGNKVNVKQKNVEEKAVGFKGSINIKHYITTGKLR